MDKILRIVTVFLVFFSCKPDRKVNIHPEQKNPVAKAKKLEVVERSKITTYNCMDYPSISYRLYIPANYDTLKIFPVIFFADPHADGIFPLEKYKPLGDKYNYLFAGSDNSKNGNPIETNITFINAIMADVLSRFSIDNNRIFVSGFSGGSRVVSQLAVLNGAIAGVIAIGGGMADPLKTTASAFYYAGIAGNRDFNMNEMFLQHELFKRTGLKNVLIIYEGKHEWPPAAVFEKAVMAIEFESMRNKKIPVNRQTIENYNAQTDIEIQKLKKDNDLIVLSDRIDEAVSLLNGLAETSKLSAEKAELEKSEVFKAAAQSWLDLEAKERNMKEQYIQFLSEKDAGWWKAEARSLQSKTKSGSKKQRLMFDRIVAYLGLSVFMRSDAAIKMGNIPDAKKFVSIYEIIEPSNSEHAFMRAKIAAKENDAVAVQKYIDKAYSLGFNDKARLSNDQDLVKYIIE